MKSELLKSKCYLNTVGEKSILVLFVILMHSHQRITGLKGKFGLVHLVLDLVMSQLVCGQMGCK